MLKYRKLLLIGAAISFIIVFVAYAGLLEFIPTLRTEAESPDGELIVKVYEKRLFPRPFFPRMGAIAKVHDKQGNLLFDKIIFHDDDWDDSIGECFREIEFVGNEIRISPGSYGRKFYSIDVNSLKPIK